MKKNLVITLLLITNFACAWFWYSNAQEAKLQRDIAERNAREASRQAEIAMLNEKLANEQRLIALKNAELANAQREEMLAQLARLKRK